MSIILQSKLGWRAIFILMGVAGMSLALFIPILIKKTRAG
jgi:hypothetical protein